jgi:ribosomal protein L29
MVGTSSVHTNQLRKTRPEELEEEVAEEKTMFFDELKGLKAHMSV